MESGGSQLPVTPVPGDAAPPSGFHEHYMHTHTHICTQTQNTQFKDTNHLKGQAKLEESHFTSSKLTDKAPVISQMPVKEQIVRKAAHTRMVT